MEKKGRLEMPGKEAGEFILETGSDKNRNMHACSGRWAASRGRRQGICQRFFQEGGEAGRGQEESEEGCACQFRVPSTG